MSRNFIYKILIGMVIFNGMLLLLASFFTVNGVDPSTSLSITDVNATYGNLNPGINPLTFLFGDLKPGSVVGGIAGVLLAIGGLVACITLKHYVVAGALLFSAIVVLLFNGTKNVLTFSIFESNAMLDGIYSIITICIGIMVMFVIIDMFAPGGVTD